MFSRIIYLKITTQWRNYIFVSVSKLARGIRIKGSISGVELNWPPAFINNNQLFIIKSFMEIYFYESDRTVRASRPPSKKGTARFWHHGEFQLMRKSNHMAVILYHLYGQRYSVNTTCLANKLIQCESVILSKRNPFSRTQTQHFWRRRCRVWGKSTNSAQTRAT